MRRLYRFAMRRRTGILVACAVVSAIGAVTMSQLTSDRSSTAPIVEPAATADDTTDTIDPDTQTGSPDIRATMRGGGP